MKEKEKQGIWELWQSYRTRTGRSVRFYRAHPLIGRGTVEHDWVSPAECSATLDQAMHIPFIMRMKHWIDRIISKLV
ncbi:MAG: hypothetical protein J6S21_03040 [Victivallales bacterium]|nr:hypothetical protein [Victivallales bacterium]